MTIKPIKTERDYQKALKEIEKLWDAKPNTAKGDRLDVLVTLVESYEQKHYRIDPPDPIEAIKFRMEQQGLTRKDLEKILGTRTRVSEVLSRKRGLSIAMAVDRVLVLSGSRVVEQGSPRELLMRRDAFAHLFATADAVHS